MNDFWFMTTCNRPRLADPAAVSAIVARYRFDWDLGVRVWRDPQGNWRLTIEGEGWPGAWRKTSADNGPQPALEGPGLEGFEALLAEIAPHLAEPLVVQAIGCNPLGFPLHACEWEARSAWQTIAKLEFSTDQTQTDQTQVAAMPSFRISA